EGAAAGGGAVVELVKADHDPARREANAGHLAAITAATGALADLVAWAEELRRSDKADAGRATLELATAAGHLADVHQNAFLSIHKPYAMRDDEPYKAALDHDDRSLITDYDELALDPTEQTLAEAAGPRWPNLDEALARVGAKGARRVPATLNVAATAMFPRLTTALATGAVMLYEIDHGADITVVCGATPVVVLG